MVDWSIADLPQISNWLAVVGDIELDTLSRSYLGTLMERILCSTTNLKHFQLGKNFCSGIQIRCIHFAFFHKAEYLVIHVNCLFIAKEFSAGLRFIIVDTGVGYATAFLALMQQVGQSEE